jgi:uncharacterized protein YndB with AHSA1/START domain
MAVDIRAEVLINRPRDEVAAYATDPKNDPIWIGGIVEAIVLTDPPFGVGTRVQRAAMFLGRRMEYTPEVVEYVPGSKVVMTADKPFAMTITYAFTDHEEGTMASIEIQGGGCSIKLPDRCLAAWSNATSPMIWRI